MSYQLELTDLSYGSVDVRSLGSLLGVIDHFTLRCIWALSADDDKITFLDTLDFAARGLLVGRDLVASVVPDCFPGLRLLHFGIGGHDELRVGASFQVFRCCASIQTGGKG